MSATCWATCLTSESSDTNLSVLLDFNSSRYLFNCGEGTTRAMLQRRKGFRKIKAIFTSGIDTDRSSGLPGLLMCSADSNTTKLDVFGPKGLEHFIASTRSYNIRETLSLNTREISEESVSPIYVDENLSVFSVPLAPNSPSAALLTSETLKRKRPNDEASLQLNKKVKLDEDLKNTADITSTSDESSTKDSTLPSSLVTDSAVQRRRQVISHIFPGRFAHSHSQLMSTQLDRRDRGSFLINEPLPRMEKKVYSLSYIVLGAQLRGKFDVAKAKMLGLKNGPIRARLARGETVVTEEGRTITPDMILGPAPRPEAVIFIDCPSPDYIPSLESSKSFKNFQTGGDYLVHCIFHLAGSKVLEDARYKKWLTSFGENVYHLVAGPDISSDRICFTSTAYMQLRLSHLDPDMFQVPKCHSPPVISAGIGEKTISLRHNDYIPLRPAGPPISLADEDPIDLFHLAVQNGGNHNASSILNPTVIKTFDRVRRQIAEESAVKILQPGNDVRVTPLGTSSAMTSKYRNVSSILVQIPNSGGILLDCGEGTFGQLCRHFGSKVSDALLDIRCIFISHLHGDHHIGLSKLLSRRRKMKPTTPVYLVANEPTILYLQEYSDLEDLGFGDPIAGVRLIYSEYVHWNKRVTIQKYKDRPLEWTELQSSQSAMRDLTSSMNLLSMETVDVWHRGSCFGFIIKNAEGWSLVYSGDTRPSNNLIRAGRDATLLIHEATLADDQTELAALKAHSTIGQAIDVAKKMRAKNVLLTHFSNRFPKTPQLATSGAADPTHPTVAIAFDHVTVSIGDMWKLSRYLPAIEQSFIDSEDPEDEGFSVELAADS
ncbi:beta-lactamase-like protein [Hysterangium stoloniferum]|nr:beta-lactamase-like protein [Hysterangium stoloniferum]